MIHLPRIVLLGCALALSAGAFAQSTMTEQQIIDYYEQGTAQGKSREAIGQELMLRGVTRAQAERAASIYLAREKADDTAPDMGDRSHTTGSVPETTLSSADPDEVLPDEADAVYGRDIFSNRNLNFVPGANMATPRNYRLGPGDEVIIDIFGAAQQTIRQTISPEGSINVEYLGPVYLNGMTVDEANSYLRKKLSSIYAGLGQSGQTGTNIRLTVGQIRSIQINVLGDVRTPGTYNISSFATVLHALYQAGGIVEPGTLRNIVVTRGGKTIGHADIYDLLSTGSRESDIRLEDGDVILVPPYTEMVKINGMVKRPMFFELKEGETLANLLSYAGGFANGAYTENISVVRQNVKNFEVFTVESRDYTRFVLQDGDEVTVNKLQSRFENRIAISGAVYFPGMYELSDNLHTVRQLVAKAGGLLPEAFTGRAVINREHDDRSLEVLSINLGEVMNGTAPDPVLRNNDELIIASQFELEDQGTMTISGAVKNPDTFPFAANTTVEDLIVMAGGLQSGASTARVDVTRRVRDPQSLTASKDLAELFTFSIKEGLVVDGQGGFVLEPYDEVVVHRSPSYNDQLHFEVTGQVNFPGTYSMTGREERLSDAVAKAGGVTAFAYVQGARLIRIANETERRQAVESADILMQNGDTTNVQFLPAATYVVAIELENALANPGGEYDILLRENDRLEIPLINHIVQTSGAVMIPSALTYTAGKPASYYIEKSGGYAQRAMRAHAYIISMNGEKKQMRSWTRVEPGDEIVVPQKEKKETDVRASISVMATAASALSTLGLTVIGILNQAKK